MKILLDECLPRKLAAALPEHDVTDVLLDACALLAFLKEEPGADVVESFFIIPPILSLETPRKSKKLSRGSPFPMRRTCQLTQ